MSNLTDDELRDAAAEAGISPQELRIALAERAGGLPATQDTGSAVGALTRGTSAAHVESRIDAPPAQALASVRASLERQTGRGGHGQGDGSADLVDDDAGLTYKIRSTPDGAGGSLVRIDIDTSAGKGVQSLAATAVAGVSLTMLALGWLFSATLVFGGLGLAALGAAVVLRNFMNLRGAAARAQALASHALMEAEDNAQRALPSSS